MQEIIRKKNYAILKITRRNGEVYNCLIDHKDIKRVEKFKWHVTIFPLKHVLVPYVLTDQVKLKSYSKYLLLHRYLLRLKKNSKWQVDHISAKTLDNRRKNLRKVTHRQNGHNQRAKGKYKTRGVSWSKFAERWCAHIKVNYRKIHLGYFDSKKQAALAAQRARNKYFTHNNEKRHLCR